jgi:SAM-dependent methyltransferase
VSIPTDQTELRDVVRARYAAAATVTTENANAASCCIAEGAPITEDQRDLFGAPLYDQTDRERLPDAAVLASLGCGNPIAIAELHEGETVLDLGSGGGIDVLLSAKRVGPTGLAYGLDMTDEMLDLARRNQAEAGVTNVQWLRGHIEEIPLPAGTVDVIISNCVINLSGDKPQVLREAARVLRPACAQPWLRRLSAPSSQAAHRPPVPSLPADRRRRLRPAAPPVHRPAAAKPPPRANAATPRRTPRAPAAAAPDGNQRGSRRAAGESAGAAPALQGDRGMPMTYECAQELLITWRDASGMTVTTAVSAGYR